jgi:hypothetical protein
MLGVTEKRDSQLGKTRQRTRAPVIGMRVRQKRATNAVPADSRRVQAAIELPWAQADVHQKPGTVEFQEARVSAASAGQYSPSCRQIRASCNRD